MITEITTLEFWINLIEKYGDAGILPPIFLAFIKAFLPPLPLIAIVSFNVAAHGPFLGFLYSWIGSCLGCTVVFYFMRHFFRRIFARFADHHARIEKAKLWVESINRITLFMIIIMPFTPSAFVNFAFGVSDYDEKNYLITLYQAKLFMIGSLALFGHSLVVAIENPWFLIISVILLIGMICLSRIVAKRNQIS